MRLWHHVVATLGPAGLRLFVDGAQVATKTGLASPQNYTGNLAFGYLNDNPSGWPGPPAAHTTAILDEVALWGRELAAQEIFALWRRGANRLRLQVRACQAPACADAPAWQGPDGTPQTAYSELDNRLGAAVLAGPPALGIATAAARYVQYRAFFESDDRLGSCTYGGQAGLPCSPELLGVKLAPAMTDPTSPYLESLRPIPYAAITHIEATFGPAGCPGGLSFALSPDGSTWWTWAGGLWQATPPGAPPSGTPLAALTPAVLAAFAQQAGAGELAVRIFFSSDGQAACELAEIAIGVGR